MRISDWSADVCSSDLPVVDGAHGWLCRRKPQRVRHHQDGRQRHDRGGDERRDVAGERCRNRQQVVSDGDREVLPDQAMRRCGDPRSEEHTSELQSLMRISYAVFCLKKKKINRTNTDSIPLAKTKT